MKTAVTTLVFCVAALLALGMVMIFSSNMSEPNAHFFSRQLVICGVGLVLCVIGACVDYGRLRAWVWPIFVLGLISLVLVFVPPIGIHRNGASRWIGYKVPYFQPSEFAKVALIILLAWYGERYQRQMAGWKRGILYPGLFIAATIGLIFREPDVGNALLIGSVSGIILLIAGIRLRYFLPPVLIAAVGLGLFLNYNKMRSERIYSWLHVEETRQGKGFQAYQAMVALGSGGVTGKGLADSRQKYDFLPEHHTDFIFAIVGEELGLIATCLIVLAFVLTVICGLYIAAHAPDTFGLLLGAGLSFLIGLQAFINIGVVTSALPNKGLPLPFISYGGSNLLMMLLCVGLLLSIARQARESEIAGAGLVGAGRSRSSRGNPFSRPRPAPDAGAALAAES
jgi:cell division protein FtsW